MYFNENVNSVVSELTKINDIIFCGSIADYFNLKKYNIDIQVKDIDIYIGDTSLIEEISNVFNRNARLINLPSEKTIINGEKIDNIHYFLPINKTHIDIFLLENKYFNNINCNVIDLYDQQIKYVKPIIRFNQLNETIDFWFENSPLTKRTLKYLKRKMLYNNSIIWN